MHPGPMNRGVEIAAEVADLPNVGDHPTRSPTASPCAWPCCSCSSGREPIACRVSSSSRAARWSTPPAAARGRRARRGRASIVGGRRRDLDAPGTVLDAVGLRGRPGPRRPPHPPARARAARRPRRSRPAPAPRPSAATPRSSPCPTPSRPSTAPPSCARCSTWARRRLCDVRVGGRHHRGPGGRAAGADGRDGRPRRAPLHRRRQPACRTPASCAGPSSTPPRLGVTLAQHCEDAALAGGGAHARGRVVEPARHPGHAGRGRGADGACATSPWPGSPAPPSTSCTSRRPARWPWSARPRPQGLPVTAEAAPHHFTLTDAEVASLRPGVQGQPAAAHRRRRGRGPQGGLGRRHHRRHRHRPRAPPAGGQGGALRPGAAGHARAGDRAGPRPHRARPADRAGARPAVVAAGPHRRPRRRARRPGRRGPPGQPLRDRPGRHVGRRARRASPAAAATRPTPGASSPAGCATRSSGASRSSSTGRRSDDGARRCSSWPTAPRSRARPSAPSRPAAWPPARSCSTRCCPATRRSSPTRPTPARSSPSPTRTSATTA